MAFGMMIVVVRVKDRKRHGKEGSELISHMFVMVSLSLSRCLCILSLPEASWFPFWDQPHTFPSDWCWVRCVLFAKGPQRFPLLPEPFCGIYQSHLREGRRERCVILRMSTTTRSPSLSHDDNAYPATSFCLPWMLGDDQDEWVRELRCPTHVCKQHNETDEDEVETTK